MLHAFYINRVKLAGTKTGNDTQIGTEGVYCNGCIRILQASVPNVSSMFSDVRCKCVYLNIVYVSHICCKYFI
jgi:hypothetical protein